MKGHRSNKNSMNGFFAKRLFANFPCATRFAQTAHQVCCDFAKKPMEFYRLIDALSFNFFHIHEGYLQRTTICLLMVIGFQLWLSKTEDKNAKTLIFLQQIGIYKQYI